MAKKKQFKNIEGAEKLQELLFPVRMAEVGMFDVNTGNVIHGEKTEDFRAVVRDDTDHMIAVPTAAYQLFPNTEFVELVDEALGAAGVKGSIRRVGTNGRMGRFKAELVVKELEAKMPDGYPVAYTAVLTNSYDGSFRTGVEHGAFRLVCSNGMKVGSIEGTFFRRHIGDLRGSLDEFIEGFVGRLKTFASDVEAEANRLLVPVMKKHAVTEAFFEELAEEANLPAKYARQMADRIVSEEVKVKTYWDLYNAMTYVLTHNVGAFLNADSLQERAREGFLNLTSTHPALR